MHLINSDCVDPDVISKIKKCISSKESVSCIGPHAIFKVVEALDSSTAFTLNFKTFENLSGVVFSFVDESEKFSESYEALVTMKSSSTTNVKALSTAISKTTDANKQGVKVACIGKSSINQAAKGISNFFKDHNAIVFVDKKMANASDNETPLWIVTFYVVSR